MSDDVVTRLRSAGCVFAEDEAQLLREASDGAEVLERMVRRRIAGEPLEQVVGWASFCGMRIAVAPGVFVPRHRTELLVDHAVRLVEQLDPAPSPLVVVDLCCGSGAIAAALHARLDIDELHASDLEPRAVRCARANLASTGARVHEGDGFASLPDGLRGSVQLVSANVPYVPASDLATLPAEARDHEPRITLDGGSDGLDVLRAVARAAPGWLAPGGWLLSEVADHQLAGASAALREAGLEPSSVRSDELDALVVVGTRTAERP